MGFAACAFAARTEEIAARRRFARTRAEATASTAQTNFTGRTTNRSVREARDEMTTLTDFTAQLRPRPTSLMQLGGFRPTDNPFASWFGRVLVSRPNESHPVHNGEPMLPLCQINCAGLPFRPSSLADIRLLTVFIAPDELPMDTANGDGWLLRAYTEQDELVPIVKPDYASPIKSFPIRYELGAVDYPCREDVAVQVPDEYDDRYDELFPNYERSKVGGYPTLIQGEL